MSTVSEKKLLTNNEVIKIVMGAVAAVGIWYRMEYKFDQVSSALLKKIDEHIISAKYEGERQDAEISQLKDRIHKMESEAQEFFKTEFIRPDETRIEGKRKRYN